MSIRNGLLALLGGEAKYGYQLKTEFEDATGRMWPLNVGQIYTTLDRLVRDGFVAVDEVEEQKRYRLTADGREELGAWWRARPREDPPPRDELMVKVLLAIATTPEAALDVVTAQRTAVLELLQHRRREQRRVRGAGASVATQLADDALVVRAEADLRWLDRCESRLQEHLRGPTGPPPRSDRDPPDRLDPPDPPVTSAPRGGAATGGDAPLPHPEPTDTATTTAAVDPTATTDDPRRP